MLFGPCVLKHISAGGQLGYPPSLSISLSLSLFTSDLRTIAEPFSNISLITPELLYIGKGKTVHLRKRNMKAIPKGVLKSKVFGVKYHTCNIIRVGSGASMPKGRS